MNRGYGLGQRSPATLPDGTKATEGHIENIVRSKYWKSLRRKIQNNPKTGRKYV